jgi:hypothetical protein
LRTEILFYHEQAVIFFNGQVALIVTIKVLSSVFCAVGAGIVIEVETQTFKLLKPDAVLAPGIQPSEYTPISFQDVVDVPDVIILTAIETIVERGSANIGAEFLVNSSME